MSNRKKYPPRIQGSALTEELQAGKNPRSYFSDPKFLLFLFAFLLYANTIPFDYALDDKLYITHNEFTKKGISGIKDILTTDLFVGFYGRQKNLVAGGRYRPLSLVSFAIEYEIFGKNPHIGHLVNAILYGFTALLLFVILLRLFPKSRSALGPGSEYLSLPFIATLLFIAHPLHTEIVANIKSRDELMSFAGALAALYFMLKYLTSKKVLQLVYSSLCFFGALMSKETTVTFIAIIPLTVYFFTPHSLKKNFVSILPLALVFSLYVAIRYTFLGAPKIEPIKELMNDPFIYASQSEKFGTIFFTLGLYIKLLLFPHPLTHDYYPWHPLADDTYKWGGGVFPYIEMSHPKAFLPLLLYAGLLIYALMGLKNKSVYAYGILVFLGSFFLTSNLVFPIGTIMNERFMYIPSLGFALILAQLLLIDLPARMKNTEKYRRILTVVLVIITGFYSIKTITRNYAWENDFSLSTTDVNASKNSAKVRMSAGGSFLDKAKEENNPAEKQKLLNESIRHLYRSLELYPTYIQPMLLMGNAYYEAKDYSNSIVFFENCLKIDPNYEYAVNNLLHLGDTLSKLGQYELAIKSLSSLLNYNKSNVRGYQMLGELYGKNLGDLAKSAEYLNKALEIEPRNTNTLQKLGVVHAMRGNPQKAVELFNAALEIEPENAHIMMNMGITLNQMGQTEKAREYLDKAFRLNPDLKRNQ